LGNWFYLAVPIYDTVRRELSWSHYRALLGVDNSEARLWYVNEAEAQNWRYHEQFAPFFSGFAGVFCLHEKAGGFKKL